MRIPLIGKAYRERSVIASAQKTINLIAEVNTDDNQAPVSVTYYTTPGLTLFAQAAAANPVRGMYRTSLGTAYIVVGASLYFLAVNGSLFLVGNLVDRPSQVYMADNGLALVVVDGVNGWAVDLVTNDFGPIIDASFYGAAFVVFLDTFFVFNRPGTNQFYISLSMVNFALLTAGTSFDPLDIAAKSGFADPIVSILSIHKELWLIGALTTEVWQGTGAADFYFQLVQGAYIQHGSIAPYSASNQDVLGFWLMQDLQGKNIVVQGSGYEVKEISTPFLVHEFNSYLTTADAIGFCFQQDSHAFYCLCFPTANKTWLYDLSGGPSPWSEWSWLNIDDGSFNRHRANGAMFFNNENLVGDWQNGKVYKLLQNVYTDDGNPIVRVKTFAHIVGDEFQRLIINSFDADIEVGTQDPAIEDEPMISLEVSLNRGVSYGFPVEQSMGLGGEYQTTVSWNRLGMGRDIICKLQWSAPIKTSLNGGFIELKKART